MLLVGGFICGLLMAALNRTDLFHVGQRGYTVGFLFFIALCLLCIWLVFMHHRSRTDSSSYEVDLLVLWTAAFSGFSLAHGGIWSDAVAYFGISWAVSAIVGGVILGVTRAER